MTWIRVTLTVVDVVTLDTIPDVHVVAVAFVGADCVRASPVSRAVLISMGRMTLVNIGADINTVADVTVDAATFVSGSYRRARSIFVTFCVGTIISRPRENNFSPI